MKKIAVIAVVAFTVGAIAYTSMQREASAPRGPDMTAIAALLEGDMKKLVFHPGPQPAGETPFTLEDDGGEATLAEFEGKWVVLNFWATWCAPCRKEMPHLSELQAEFGGDRFEVVTIATGRNSPVGIKQFLAEIGVDNLPRHQDERQKLAQEMGVFGLPITVILDPRGREVARMRGDANWASDSAKAMITALLDTE